MATERLVKWSKEAQEFFENAKDNSVVLDLVISYSCASQTGEGFEELVNTINSESIKRKVKKVVITDTSYLYRHTIPKFARYSDPSIPTEWYLKNIDTIKKLTVDVELKSWAEGLNNSEFIHWTKIIESNFFEVQEFRDLIVYESKVAHESKVVAEARNCMDFILEESVYVCANMKNSILVYPIFFTPSFLWIVKKYTNIKQLHYKISRQAQHNLRGFALYNISKLDEDKVDKKLVSFIKYDITNINFYVIDKEGNYVYRNREFFKITGEISNARDLDKDSWSICVEVMKENKQKILEEKFKNNTYLSIKSPLIMDGKVEGVIGFAVDITDRKKVECLQNELKIQKELFDIAKKVAHDICSPISSLKIIQSFSRDKLSEQEKEMLDLSIKSINDMSQSLIEKCEQTKELTSGKKHFVINKIQEQYISLYSMHTIINCKRYQCQGKAVTINFTPLKDDKIIFIKGDLSNFQRMINNLLNNAIEAVEGKDAIVEVSYIVRNNKVEIMVKDNGNGIPKNVVEKIMNGVEIETTKKDGHGIGIQQIMSTVKEMNGQVEIKSKKNEGTEFILKFEKVQIPEWVTDKIELQKDGTLVVLSEQVYKY
jgi:signal transduction histidine kinase